MKRRLRIWLVNFFLSFHLFSVPTYGMTKTSTASGNWGTPSIWSPSGVPTINDEVIVLPTHKIILNVNGAAQSLRLHASSELSLQPGTVITLNGNLSVEGKLDMNGGDILQQMQNAAFVISNTGVFIWNPGDNTMSGATLFLKSTEQFAPASSLLIKKWYSYTTVPLGSVVSGNFGNVAITTLVGSTLFEWNQDNQFESHQIKGTLTIDQGWVVLDKGGHISNTTIGSIYLMNVNAVLDFHSGTHPSAFRVNTDSIVNIGGEINGLLNGNGNISLHVSGNFTNLGNVELIYNAGVANVGNGNADLTVGGAYRQSHGDLRGVFNLSTTNAGSATMTFGSLELTGGLLMGFYGCTTSSSLTSITVHGDLIVSLWNVNDKFRVIGLTSLAGQFSNAKSELNVTGNLNLTGIAAAEFTTSGSVGTETVHVTGNVTIGGLSNNFNFGSHSTAIKVDGDFKIAGGYTYLSRFPGATQVVFNKDVILSAGTLAVKGSTGIANFDVVGNYIQTGGNFILHNNTSMGTNDAVQVNMKGAFNQLNGTINFDDNAASSSTHIINIKGNLFNVDGTSVITRAGAGTSGIFGSLNFSSNGTLFYKRMSLTASIDQVKQNIRNLCQVEVMSGRYLLASHSVPNLDALTIDSGAVLQMNSAQMVSNGRFAYSGFSIKNMGKLITRNANGFYNSTGTATVKANVGFNYFLEPLSMIEYNGNSIQLISGIGNGIAVGEQHKYGILILNYSGSNSQDYAAPADANVSVRKKLILQNGMLKLSLFPLTIENGSQSALERQHGFIKSESVVAALKWKNMAIGTYTIPFGNSVSEYLPLVYSVLQGSGNVSFYSYKTNPANEPWPDGISAVMSGDHDISITSVMDRFYGMEAAGIKADITLSFPPDELATSAQDGDEILIISHQQDTWKSIPSSATVEANRINTIQATDVNANGVLAVVLKKDFRENYFHLSGRMEEGVAQLNFNVSDDTIGSSYLVERSHSGMDYSAVADKNSNGLGSYTYTDLHPLKGVSYYRIKKKVSSSTFRYSDVLVLVNGSDHSDKINIETVYPNPFDKHITVKFTLAQAGLVHVSLIPASGQLVYLQEQQFEAGNNTYNCNLPANLPGGVYTLQLTSSATTVYRKLIKQ